MASNIHDVDILRKFGIKVPKNQVGETMSTILSDPELAKEIESIKASMGTMINEDYFIDVKNSLLSLFQMLIKQLQRFLKTIK